MTSEWLESEEVVRGGDAPWPWWWFYRPLPEEERSRGTVSVPADRTLAFCSWTEGN